MNKYINQKICVNNAVIHRVIYKCLGNGDFETYIFGCKHIFQYLNSSNALLKVSEKLQSVNRKTM